MNSIIDKLVALVDDFEPAKFMPQVDTIVGQVELWTRISVMVGPLILLGLGLWYYLAPPKEANHSVGYRFYWGMGSVEAWQFTQRLAGIVWASLGLLLTVIMALICNGYRGMEAMEMVESAVSCVLWELGLVAAACIAINVVVALRYDKAGNRRKAPEDSPQQNT